MTLILQIAAGIILGVFGIFLLLSWRIVINRITKGAKHTTWFLLKNFYILPLALLSASFFAMVYMLTKFDYKNGNYTDMFLGGGTIIALCALVGYIIYKNKLETQPKHRE